MTMDSRRLNQWALPTLAFLLLVGASVSEETEVGFLEDACYYRSWEDLDPLATQGNCDLTCDPDQFYNPEDNSCDPCPPNHFSVYGHSLWFPVGEEACQPRAYCVEDDDMCHKCGPVRYTKYTTDFHECECRPGFKVERKANEDGDLFFTCRRDCEEERGGCAQRCEPGEEDGEPAECSCAEGFEEEEDGEVCKDIDECKTGENMCRMPNRCKNWEGGYSCICAPGFMASEDGKRCKRANGGNELVCTISILEITAPYELDSEEKDFAGLTDPEDPEEFDESRIELLFREVLSGTGSWANQVNVEPTFVNGHLEFQVMVQFSPELDVEQETMFLSSLSERLARTGYSTEVDGDSVYISRPIYCFSKTTGGIPLPADAPCEWYEAAGYCLQNSRCAQDGGRPYCQCPDGWYGSRCEIGEITIVDIVLIVMVVLLNIKFIILCCYVCMTRRRRSCHCGRSSCDSCSSKAKVYAKTTKVTHMEQPFPAPIKYQSTGLVYGTAYN